MVDDVRPARARMHENAGHRLAEIGVGDEQERDDRQRPAHGAAHGFEQHHDQDRAHDDVDRQRISDAEGEFAVDPRHVKGRNEAGDAEHPVMERQTERGERAGLDLLLAEGGEAQKHDKKRHTQMQAAMHGGLRNAEAGRIEMVARQEEQDRRRDQRHRPGKHPEAKLRIVGFLDCLQFVRREMAHVLSRLRLLSVHVHGPRHVFCFLRNRGRAIAARPLGDRYPWKGIRMCLTSEARLPCRTSRHPDGAECRRRRARFPW